MDLRVNRRVKQAVAAAVVAFFKAVVRPELAGQQPLGHGRVGQQGHLVLPAPGRGVVFHVTPEQGVGRLETDDGTDPTGRLELVQRKVRHPDGPDFTLVLELHQGLQGLFQGYRFGTERSRRPVDLIQIEVIGSQVFQGALTSGDHLIVGQVIGKYLGKQLDLGSAVADRLAQHAFRMSLAVLFGGVEGGDAGIHGGVDGPLDLIVIDAGPHRFAGLPSAHDDRRQLDVRVAQGD